jgi:hypothetical protein
MLRVSLRDRSGRLKKILTANRWLGRRFSSMKKSFLITAIITTSVATLATSNAQSLTQKAKEALGNAAGAIKEATTDEKPSNSGNAAIQAALDKIKEDIRKSSQILNQASKPNEEKLKEFDKMVGQIDDILKVSQEGGEYDKLIDDTYKKNKEKLALMKNKSNDTSLTANQRAAYEKKMPQFEATIESLGNNRIKLIRISNDLKKQREQIAQSKQFYVDMISIDELAEANKSVESVNSSMQVLVDKIQELGEVGSQLNQTSGPALK